MKWQQELKAATQKIRTAWEYVWRPWRRFEQKWPRLSKWIAWPTRVFSALIGLLILFWLGIALSVPSVRELREVQTQIASEIYSDDGVLLGRYFNQYRTVVQYADIPTHIIHALVATEDERYFKHKGVDYRSWGRVFYRTILRRDDSGGGGSTISQQLAKNLFPRRNYRFLSLPINKISEIITARRLERAYNKEQLLALYLNTVPFSENIYGLDVASRRFFSKAPAELTIEEGATLIGSLKATSTYNPAKAPDRTKQRRNVVLAQMLKNDYLSKPICDSLQQLPLVVNYNPVINNQGVAPYFREFVRQEALQLLSEMRKPNGEPYDLYTDGLKIHTTLNSDIQRIAEEAVNEHMSQLQSTFDRHWRGQKPWGDDAVIDQAMRASKRYKDYQEQGLNEAEILAKFEEKIPMTIFSWEGDSEVEMSPLDSIRYHFALLQVGFMAMEPYTGYIRAWVGGIDYDHFQYDHVRAQRQTGSVYKPIIYAQALRSGIPPCEQLPNRLTVYHEYAKGDWAIKDPRRDDPDPHISPEGKDEDDWVPQNADGKYGGSYSMQGALTNSVNTISVSLIMRTGVQPVIELSRRLGITGEIPEEPSIALGTAEVSLYDMVGAFGTIASRGRKTKPIVISRIETHDGKILARFDQGQPEQILTETQADMVTHMLQSVASYGTASRLKWKYGLYNYAIAGKTGTTQNQADGWFIGFTPNLVAGAWVGGDSPLVRFRTFEYGQGAATALPVWGVFMKKLLEDPAFAAWKEAKFPELPPDISRELACTMRIKSAEELLADSLAADTLLPIDLEFPAPDSTNTFF
jgi:penicillin-binding protein 1A